MSLGMAAGSFTQGYLGQEGVEKKRSAMEGQARGQAEERKLKMDQIKQTMKKENFHEALKHMIAGDFAGAEKAYGQAGERKMREGSAKAVQDEEGNTFFTWIDDESGEPVTTEMRYAMLATGINPNMLETPEQKHARAMELQNAKTAGGKGTPADVKLYNHIITNLKNPKTGKKYTPEEAWREARRSPESRLKIASQMASSYMRANPGVSAEETQAHVDKMMLGLEQNYGDAGGGMAGPGGGSGLNITEETLGYIEAGRKLKAEQEKKAAQREERESTPIDLTDDDDGL